MEFPSSLYTQYAGNYCTKIGQDFRGVVKYNFNKNGFINDIDYDVKESKAICFFGSAITSGIGLPWQQSYSFQTAKLFGEDYKSYNFSQGCMFVDNKEILNTVKQVKNMENFKPFAYVIQFIGLDRIYHPSKEIGTLSIDSKKNIETFETLFDELQNLLKNDKWVFLGCDGADHKVSESITKHKNCLIWNPRFIDNLLRDLPGPKWHKMISLGVKNKITDLYSIK
tara:strand:- start:660 stop:1334 length:675 start_codon:yes stop_codon:yes gene_type:complete